MAQVQNISFYKDGEIYFGNIIDDIFLSQNTSVQFYMFVWPAKEGGEFILLLILRTQFRIYYSAAYRQRRNKLQEIIFLLFYFFVQSHKCKEESNTEHYCNKSGKIGYKLSHFFYLL